MISKIAIPRGIMGFPCEEQADPFAAFKNAVEQDVPSRRTLYIHIPYCRSRCPFCPFFLETASAETIHFYAQLVCRELEGAAEMLGRFPVNAVYFGGGTPTELAPDDFRKIMKVVRSRYPLANDCEITVEGRIDGFGPEKLDAYAACGVNRFSIGIQTFRTEMRKRLGRVTSKEDILRTLNRIVAWNQASVVIDLMYGLPGETLEEWLDDLHVMRKETKISGVDFYQLKSRKHLPLEKLTGEGVLPPLPSQDACFEMFNAAVGLMKDCGANRLSSMHYALESRERNLNNSISSYKNVCLPFGMKAVGRLGGYRMVQTADLDEYESAVNSGRKPLASVGLLPADFPVCGELSGEMYNNMGLNPLKIAGVNSGLSGKILERLENAVPKWVGAGYLLPEKNGWFQMTELAKFIHRPMATDLMEAIAEAWK